MEDHNVIQNFRTLPKPGTSNSSCLPLTTPCPMASLKGLYRQLKWLSSRLWLPMKTHILHYLSTGLYLSATVCHHQQSCWTQEIPCTASNQSPGSKREGGEKQRSCDAVYAIKTEQPESNNNTNRTTRLPTKWPSLHTIKSTLKQMDKSTVIDLLHKTPQDTHIKHRHWRSFRSEIINSSSPEKTMEFRRKQTKQHTYKTSKDEKRPSKKPNRLIEEL